AGRARVGRQVDALAPALGKEAGYDVAASGALRRRDGRPAASVRAGAGRHPGPDGLAVGEPRHRPVERVPVNPAGITGLAGRRGPIGLILPEPLPAPGAEPEVGRIHPLAVRARHVPSQAAAAIAAEVRVCRVLVTALAAGHATSLAGGTGWLGGISH